MNAEHPHAGTFQPGDRVEVVSGTFITMSGRVIDVAEVRTLHAKSRRPAPRYVVPARLGLAGTANLRRGSSHSGRPTIRFGTPRRSDTKSGWLTRKSTRRTLKVAKPSSGIDYGDHTLQLWDISTGRLRLTIEGHTDNERSVVFSRTAAPWYRAARTRRSASGRPPLANKLRLLGHEQDSVNQVAVSPDGMRSRRRAGRRVRHAASPWTPRRRDPPRPASR